jgi:N-acetyl-anhydromuramyl-L-alanine amidase AmpD
VSNPAIVDHPARWHGGELEPKGIVIHSMGSSIRFGDGRVFPAEVWLDRRYDLIEPREPKNKASAHVLVQPDGTLVRCLDHLTVAYHAGESAWMGYTRLNYHFLGIEVLVAGIHTWGTYLRAIGRDPDAPTVALPVGDRPPSPYTKAQYASTAWCIRQWQRECDGLERPMIAGHEQVSPGRKPDPGPSFDWEILFDELRALKMKEAYDADQGDISDG